jgi:hypothetical protein
LIHILQDVLVINPGHDNTQLCRHASNDWEEGGADDEYDLDETNDRDISKERKTRSRKLHQSCTSGEGDSSEDEDEDEEGGREEEDKGEEEEEEELEEEEEEEGELDEEDEQDDKKRDEPNKKGDNQEHEEGGCSAAQSTATDATVTVRASRTDHGQANRIPYARLTKLGATCYLNTCLPASLSGSSTIDISPIMGGIAMGRSKTG